MYLEKYNKEKVLQKKDLKKIHNTFVEHLRNKNFKNHNNYNSFPDKQKIYRKYIIKKKLKEILFTSLFFSAVFVGLGLGEYNSQTLNIRFFIGMYIFLSGLLGTMFLIRFFWEYVTKLRKEKHEIIQKSMDAKKHGEILGKIFFY